MPSVNDPAFNEEDTPDDLLGPKPSKKKKQKKAAKQKISDEYKDSSSEGPKLSPDLLVPLLNLTQSLPLTHSLYRPAIVDHSNPSPPPSPPPHLLDGLTPEGDLLDHLSPSYDKPATIKNRVLSSEPSPPQDGVIATRDNTAGAGVLPVQPVVSDPIQHVSSLSSSPQGGIRLPPNSPRLHTYSPPRHAPIPIQERKPSMNSPQAKPTSFFDAPLPHLPQRHFSRRPDMDFGMENSTGTTITAGTKGYYCGFDSLENANAGTSPAANNLVLVGTQCGLDVYRLLRQRSDVVGRLEHLPGAVTHAKILPWSDHHDPFSALRPLVMCVLWGPVEDTANEAKHLPQESTRDTALYQTTVRIYSLATAESLCTLYTSPAVATHHSAPPESHESISIAAEGRFITVTLGASGEIYVFAPYTSPFPEELPPFRCIAKLWTTTNTYPPPSASDGHGSHHEEPRTKTPISALSQRWLAIKPPVLSSSQISLQGIPLLSPKHPDPPGVSSHVSPPPPMVNCEVDAPYSNTLFDRVAKHATLEIRKGASWVGEQGKHVWKTYWGRPSPSQGESVPSKHTARIEPALFPPTHAQTSEPHPSPVEPALVSIVDLQKLLDFEENPTKGALAPLLTFTLPDGCSFMSFAPGGLSVLITNQSGDASTIWDLTRITNGVPFIPMAIRLARQTPSVVADVAWSAHGNRVALLTLKGTIHLHELPRSFFCPVLHNGGALAQAHITPSSPGTSPPNSVPLAGFVSNVRAWSQTIPGITLRAPTVSNASAFARNTGRRALKQGVNMATDTALKIRHHEENKIRLQQKQQSSGPARLSWLSGRDNGLIAIIVDGKVRLYTVKTNQYEQGQRPAVYLTASRRPVGETSLHQINSSVPSTAPRGMGHPTPHGFWALNRANAVKRAVPGGAKQHSGLVVQDKDTSPVCLPFHRSPQVNLFIFGKIDISNKSATVSPAGPGTGSEEAWVFGLPLNPAKRITCQQASLEHDDTHDALDDEDLLGQVPHFLQEGNGEDAREAYLG